MRVATPLIFDLARGVDVDRLLATERSLEIPAGLVPQIELPLAQQDPAPFSVGDPQRAGFYTHSRVIRTNQAETIVDVCTFGQGVWLWYLDLWYVANFDAFTASGNGGAVFLQNPAALSLDLLRVEPVAGVVQRREAHFRTLFTDDGWRVRLNHFTTSVGQTGHIKLAVQAAKLI